VTQNDIAPVLPSVSNAAGAPLDAAAIFAMVGEVPYAWDLITDDLMWGANLGDVLKGFHAAMVPTGRTFALKLDGDNSQTRFDAISQAALADQGNGVPYQVQYRVAPQMAGDTATWVEDVGRWFAGADGKPARAIGVVRVINERRATEERLAYLSKFDGLTGEMNRWHLMEVLEATLDESVRFRSSCAFLIAAVDSLARVNESYGFDVADEVIAAVAKRLRAKLRGGDSLGRFSGNKFGIILKSCSLDDIVTAAERLLAGVRDDVVQTQAGPVAVTITIGGVVAPRHARTVHEVLSRAQEALDSAKAKRRGSFHVYRPNIERDALRRENARSTDEIVSALNERRITVAFEPVVSAITRAPVFYECLMRIRRGDGTLVPANDIIPVAERLGLVRLLDHRVLELVAEEMNRSPVLNASVNVSPASTCDPDWWSGLTGCLRANPGIAERLIIEITEMAAIQDIDDTRGFVRRVKDLGCRIAIDDFGAGYTSFRNLRKLGVDVIKIDGAFVQNLTRSEDDRAFVHTLVDLAQRLSLATVAEWVQDEESAAMLARWGCDFLQGALIGLASLEKPWLAGEAAKGDIAVK
jgi:diguanylate cyclase (GGDEF)-like protein